MGNKNTSSVHSYKSKDRKVYCIAALFCIIAFSIATWYIYHIFSTNCINVIEHSFSEKAVNSLNISTLIYYIIAASMLVIGAALTFIAFWVQYSFNKEQKQDIFKERFENKYFNLLKVYRSNANTTVMDNVGHGKHAFHFMFYEFKAIYFFLWNNEEIDSWIDSKNYNNTERYEYKNKLILNAAFSFFLNGASKSAIQIIKATAGDLPESTLSNINKQLLEKQEYSLNQEDVFLIKEGKFISSKKIIREKEIAEGKQVPYIKDYAGKRIKLFDGHRLRLIHYYRLIYTIFEWVVIENKIADPKSNKRKGENKLDQERIYYLRFLLDEMSEHEVALLKAFHAYVERDIICKSAKEYQGELGKYFDYIFEEYITSPTFNWEDDLFFESKQ